MPSADSQQPLRDDVRLLGGLLGETLVRQEGDELFQRVERVRAAAKRARARTGAGTPSDDVFQELTDELGSMPLDAALPVARAFAQFLHLANVAEQHHRIRRRRVHQRDPHAGPQPHSLDETLPRLAAAVGPDRLHAAVLALRIELVMTAHPTEIMRRTLQRKYTAVAEALAGLDRPDLTPLERDALVDGLRREITAAWETEEVRRERPSPLDEVRSVFGVFEHTIWNAVPEYLRALDRTLRTLTGRGLPLDAAPIRFGSWIGGDRDGNPAITAAVTRRACLGARWVALTLYARDVAALREDLSMTQASDALRTGRPNPTARCCATSTAASNRRGARCRIVSRRGRARARALSPWRRSSAPPRISSGRCACVSTRCTKPATALSRTAPWRTCCGGSRASGSGSRASISGRRRRVTPRRSI
jgi:phosphoenolpyruvate carboxylase